MTGNDTYPVQSARTRRFTLGLPRAWTCHPDGGRLRFLMSRHGRDPVQCLWELSTDDGSTRCLVDPHQLAQLGDTDVEAERSRRERARELASGITAYDVDTAGNRIVFTVQGTLYLFDAVAGETTAISQVAGAFDPRISPDGSRVAVVVDDALQCIDLSTMDVHVVIAEPEVRWASAEFVAAEEMGRSRGFWWAPDSQRILATRVDEREVDTWYIADPSQPAAAPRPHAYPAAGRPNADVQLAILSLDGAPPTPVEWDRHAWPYVVNAIWQHEQGQPDKFNVVVQSRDQRQVVLLDIDDAHGTTTVRWQQQCDAPIELVAGVPSWAGSRRVTVEDDADINPPTRRLVVDGAYVSPPALQVRSVLGADAEQVVFTASAEPTAVSVWRWTADEGVQQVAGSCDSVTAATVCGPWLAIAHSDLSGPAVRIEVRDSARTIAVQHCSETPVVTPQVTHLTVGEHDIRVALLMPPHGPDASLPVLLDPYGGPHAQRVLASARAYLTAQWFANHGFAVIIADGRGTPGRGPIWERAVQGDLAAIPLADQLAALDAVAAQQPHLDLTRVGIRGWSFGGYLAALAATRAPDRIHAASIGAPVTDWRLYDTHYTERYLGHPDDDRGAYDRSNVIGPNVDLYAVPEHQRPALQIIHGLADDNVVVAHALRLSQALLLAGWEHEFVPLTGVTHFTTHEDMTARLLERELAFFQRALAVARAERDQSPR